MSESKQNLLFIENSGNYAETVMSYYLWGKSQPPSDKNIADVGYIRPKEAITISSSTKEYMKNVGYNVLLPQQKIFHHNMRAGAHSPSVDFRLRLAENARRRQRPARSGVKTSNTAQAKDKKAV